MLLAVFFATFISDVRFYAVPLFSRALDAYNNIAMTSFAYHGSVRSKDIAPGRLAPAMMMYRIKSRGKSGE